MMEELRKALNALDEDSLWFGVIGDSPNMMEHIDNPTEEMILHYIGHEATKTTCPALAKWKLSHYIQMHILETFAEPFKLGVSFSEEAIMEGLDRNMLKFSTLPKNYQTVSIFIHYLNSGTIHTNTVSFEIVSRHPHTINYAEWYDSDLLKEIGGKLLKRIIGNRDQKVSLYLSMKFPE